MRAPAHAAQLEEHGAVLWCVLVHQQPARRGRQLYLRARINSDRLDLLRKSSAQARLMVLPLPW